MQLRTFYCAKGNFMGSGLSPVGQRCQVDRTNANLYGSGMGVMILRRRAGSAAGAQHPTLPPAVRSPALEAPA